MFVTAVMPKLMCAVVILTLMQVSDEFVLHVWVPSHKVAKECVRIGRELTSPLPNCTVML